MTHKDIYTKFMIEYDKAGASTSYPSLTEYEVATVLDKAYNALIAQKVTGNNYRRVGVEGDLKSIADLGPLTKSEWVSVSNDNDTTYNYPAPNVTACAMPEDLLYILGGSMKYTAPSTKYPTEVSPTSTHAPIDKQAVRGMPVKLINHDIASKFFSTSSNIPWIKEPVCFIEDRHIYIVYDPMNSPIVKDQKDPDTQKLTKSFRITYIRRPQTFVKGLPDGPHYYREATSAEISDNNKTKYYYDSTNNEYSTTGTGTPYVYVGAYVTYFDYTSDLADTQWDGEGNEDASLTYKDRYEFEGNSTLAEELISLAVAFALENVESQRLNSKLNMRGLEA